MITVGEIIKGHSGLGNISQTSIERVCTDYGLSYSIPYEASLSKKVDLAIADLLIEAVNDPDYNEHDVSETLSREKMLESANNLFEKHGVAKKGVSKIYNRTNIW